jgi:hypothetical protein
LHVYIDFRLDVRHGRLYAHLLTIQEQRMAEDSDAKNW